MDEKDFFAKLAGVGPDGKFSNFSQKKNGFNENKNGDNLNLQKNEGIFDLNRQQAVSAGRQDLENFENENEIKTDDGNSQEIEIFDGPEGQLAVDVFSIPTHFIIEAAIAGVKADDIDISITTDSVVIKGKRQRETKEETKDYLFQECFWGRFSRLITLPEEIDADKSHASFKNGILKIILPKINRQKSKKIKVKFD